VTGLPLTEKTVNSPSDEVFFFFDWAIPGVMIAQQNSARTVVLIIGLNGSGLV
jgi:hypothetical protein